MEKVVNDIQRNSFVGTQETINSGIIEDPELIMSARKRFNPESAREIRKAMGMTQEELGRVVGYSKQFISQIERGDTPLPKNNSAIRYLSALVKNGLLE